MNGRRLGVAAVLLSAMLGAGTASAADDRCAESVARGEYLTRARLLVEARTAMLEAGEECTTAREHAADLAWRIPKVFLHVAGRSDDEVTLLVDGNVIARAEAKNALRLNPGEHVFVARTGEGGERHVTFFLAEGETRSVTVDFTAGTIVPTAPVPEKKTAGGSVPPLAWGGFGLAALGLAVGAGAGVVSMAKASDLEERCVSNACPASVRDDVDSARTWSTVSTAAFVTAAVGVVIGVVALTVRPKETFVLRF